MYIARTFISVAGRDGKTTTVSPGDPIESFETWPYESQRAMLRLGRVEKLGAREAANLTTDGGYLHFEGSPKAPSKHSAAQIAPAAPKQPENIAWAPVAKAVKSNTVGCPLCPREFETEPGLKRHITKTHKAAP